jgi:hypothetical protein
VGCREAADQGFTVREALAQVDPRGNLTHRMGLIASGDSHDGRPGANPEGAEELHRCQSAPMDEDDGEWDSPWYRIEQAGLVCAYVQAPSREEATTREQIFDALQNRSVYGTTGARIGVWFEVEHTARDGSVTSHRMGQEFEVDTDADERTVARIQVTKDGEELDRVELLWLDPTTAQWEVCQQWDAPASPMTAKVDLSQCSSRGANAYYLRVEQQPRRSGSFLVTSEVRWIDFYYGGQQLAAPLAGGWYDSAEELAAEVQSSINGQVPGKDPFQVTYDIASGSFRIMADQEFDLLWGSGGVHTAAGLLGFDQEDDLQASAHESDFGILSDGLTEREMAWSSPVWITHR